MIQSLQSWRFIFAVMIFLHHFSYNGSGLFHEGGAAGVCFFMILSGFVMCAGYGDKTTLPSFSFKTFMKKRLVRIYPLHLICFAAFLLVLVCGRHTTVNLSLVPNLLLLQSWIPIKEIYFSGNAVSWCLSDFLFFYAMFPLLNNFRKRHERMFFLVLLAVIATYLAGVTVVNPGKEAAHAWLYIHPLFRLIDFSIGMAVYSIYEDNKDRGCLTQGYAKSTMVECAAIAMLVISLVFMTSIDDIYHYSCWFWLSTICILLVFSLLQGGVSRLLTCKILVKLGDVSFELYMVHNMLMMYLNRMLELFGIDIVWYVKLPIYLSVTIAISFLVKYKMEKPVTAYLTQKFL